jgi:calcium-dependent protein kinase
MGCLNSAPAIEKDMIYTMRSNSKSRTLQHSPSIPPSVQPSLADDTQSQASQVEAIKIQPRQFVHSKVGSVWEDYQQIGLLGKGANGSVFEAISKSSSERRAVKVLPKRKLRLAAEALKKFKIELNILKQMDHPNILKIYECYEDSENFYLVTEFLTGGELFDYIIKKRVISEPMAASFMEQLLGAINYCHANNIVHRDLKPENLLREHQGDNSPIKVIDFGESTLISPGQKLNSVLGTAYYIAPEVLQHNYNEKCDIWSCGVIMFILLSGTPPFAGRSDTEIISKVRTGRFSFGNRSWRKVSEEAKNLIERMMTMDPSARISAQEALRHPWFSRWRNSNPEDSSAVLGCMDSLKSFRSSSKLKHAVQVFIAAQLISKEERDNLTLAFKSLDANKDGRLSREELIEGLLAHFPRKVAVSKAKEILENCDVDRSGYIDYTEFLSAGMRMESSHNTMALKAAFKMFDTDGSGKISLEELRRMLGPELLQGDVAWQNLLREADANGDGEIDLSEFQQLVLKL